MSISKYTLEDLQWLDDLCLAEAKTMGLEPPETLFHLVQSEEMYDIAARGLPGRYSHWRFGRDYENQKGNYDRGRGRIYELVINTRPVHAYLLDGNSLVAQLLTIAHVYGHSTVFEHNAYFGPADKNILSRVRSATERIDRYIGEYGRTRVEDFIDACQSLEHQGSWDQLGDSYKSRPPELEHKDYDILFPDEYAQRQIQHKLDKEAYRLKFPKDPERNILAFIEAHSRVLEDWQKDIISIIRSEREYFVPQGRTQVLNEGVAVTWHNTIMQRIMAQHPDKFNTDDFMEYQAMNASVLHPRIHFQPLDEGAYYVHCDDLNPYLLGSIIFEDITRICTNPTKDDKEKFDWAGKADPIEKRTEVIQGYNDVALMADFITPDICQRAKLFMQPRLVVPGEVNEYKDLYVSKEECEQVIKVLCEQRTSFGVPVVEIVDADNELWMEHRHNGVGLDEEYTNGTLQNIVTLWGRPAIVKTVVSEEGKDPKSVWYKCSTDGHVTSYNLQPKKE